MSMPSYPAVASLSGRPLQTSSPQGAASAVPTAARRRRAAQMTWAAAAVAALQRCFQPAAHMSKDVVQARCDVPNPGTGWRLSGSRLAHRELPRRMDHFFYRHKSQCFKHQRTLLLNKQLRLELLQLLDLLQLCPLHCLQSLNLIVLRLLKCTAKSRFNGRQTSVPSGPCGMTCVLSVCKDCAGMGASTLGCLES